MVWRRSSTIICPARTCPASIRTSHLALAQDAAASGRHTDRRNPLTGSLRSLAVAAISAALLLVATPQLRLGPATLGAAAAARGDALLDGRLAFGPGDHIHRRAPTSSFTRSAGTDRAPSSATGWLPERRPRPLDRRRCDPFPPRIPNGGGAAGSPCWWSPGSRPDGRPTKGCCTRTRTSSRRGDAGCELALVASGHSRPVPDAKKVCPACPGDGATVVPRRTVSFWYLFVRKFAQE